MYDQRENHLKGTSLSLSLSLCLSVSISISNRDSHANLLANVKFQFGNCLMTSSVKIRCYHDLEFCQITKDAI